MKYLLQNRLTTVNNGTSNSVILSNNYVSLLSDRLKAHVYKRENGITNETIVIGGQLQPLGEDLEVAKK